MQHDYFVNSRREYWAELESLLDRAAHGRVSRLDGDEIIRLGSLYRVAASDLALARKSFPTARATLYLNGLVRRAHPIIYQPATSRAEIGGFIRFGLPACYRKVWPYTATAIGIFVLSAGLAAAAVAFHSSNAGLLLGQDEAQSLRGVMRLHHLWMGSNTSNHSVAANFIMLNNVKVAFVAFAGGILVGLGTIYIMAQNGIMLGAIGAMVAQYGLSRQFWSFVVPHGVLELSVVFLSGGAGLMMGDAILRPGLKTRARALADAARTSALVLLGCVPLLIIAGTIEGFFSASSAPAWLKIGLGIVSGVLLYTYLLRSRASNRQQSLQGADSG